MIEAPDEALDVQVDCPTCCHKFWPGNLPPSAIARVPDAEPHKEPAPDWVRLRYLQAVHEWVDKLRRGDTNQATARYEVGKVLKSLDYTPEKWFPESANIPPAIEETMRRLSVQTCVQTVLETLRSIANGFGMLKAGSSDIALYMYPAWELVRYYDVEIPRGKRKGPNGEIVDVPGDGWPDRFQKAGGKLVNGRMIALKGDPVWIKLGSCELFGDALGNPFPPFAINSGMRWNVVSRTECLELGVIKEEPSPNTGEPVSKFINFRGEQFDRDILQAAIDAFKDA
jgi:hypothetical protein